MIALESSHIVFSGRIILNSGFIVLWLALFATYPLKADGLNALESQGKQFYLTGITMNNDPVKAYFGASSVEVPSSFVPCVNCHGIDGLGRPEGSVIPSNLTWDYLLKPYGHHHPNNRVHPAFTASTLIKAIIEGVDPAGNRLDSAMPRYQLTEPQAKALIAYLQKMGSPNDPGLTDNELVIGLLIPKEGKGLEIGRAMQETIEAYFHEINENGGIFNRHIRLKPAVPSSDFNSTVNHIHEDIGLNKAFALLSALASGSEIEFDNLLAKQGIPLIAPFRPINMPSDGASRFIFYLLPGSNDRARVLTDFAAKQLSLNQSKLIILVPNPDRYKTIIETVKKQAAKQGWKRLEVLAYRETPLASIVQRVVNSDAVMFFGIDRIFIDLVNVAESLKRKPYWLLSEPTANPKILNLPLDQRRKIYFAASTFPIDRNKPEIRYLTDLHEKYRLSDLHFNARIYAYLTAKILVEGLKRAGKEITRYKFISSLEQLFDLETGLIPPITFTENKRVGALGAYIISLENDAGQFKIAQNWKAPEY